MIPPGPAQAAGGLAAALRERSLLGLSAQGFQKIAYSEWGDPEAPRTLICVHGLTRNRHDFDPLCRVLSAAFRIACPDVVGRGGSDWLKDPDGYGYPQYLSDMNALIARLGVEEVDWLGTSMGGLIGMMLAAQPGTPVRRLIVNDVGPFIPKAALERIAGYVGKDPRFPDLAAAEAYFREVHAPFGRLSDAQWQHLTRQGVSRDESGEGGFRLRYDPGIGKVFADAPPEDVDLWGLWERIACPVLVLRGAESDLLPAEIAQEMTRRGPRATLVEFSDCGHAPALMDEAQTSVVRDWLAGGEVPPPSQD